MLLCDFIVDNDWALSFCEVRRFCANEAVKVNGEVEKNYCRPVSPGDKVSVGKHKEGVVA